MVDLNSHQNRMWETEHLNIPSVIYLCGCDFVLQLIYYMYNYLFTLFSIRHIITFNFFPPNLHHLLLFYILVYVTKQLVWTRMRFNQALHCDFLNHALKFLYTLSHNNNMQRAAIIILCRRHSLFICFRIAHRHHVKSLASQLYFSAFMPATWFSHMHVTWK